MVQLHDRMPVFLAGADVADWLDPDCRDEGHLRRCCGRRQRAGCVPAP